MLANQCITSLAICRLFDKMTNIVQLQDRHHHRVHYSNACCAINQVNNKSTTPQARRPLITKNNTMQSVGPRRARSGGAGGGEGDEARGSGLDHRRRGVDPSADAPLSSGGHGLWIAPHHGYGPDLDASLVTWEMSVAAPAWGA